MVTTHMVTANIKNILAILQGAIYSDSWCFLREILQNALDSLVARSGTDPRFQPLIKITVDAEIGRIRIEDNGIAMSREQIIEWLCCLGGSGKGGNDLGPFREEIIGQFGIGFFAALRVAEQIEVISQTPHGEATRMQMVPTGSYTLETCATRGVGTVVDLYLDEEHSEYANEEDIIKNIKKWADFIPYPIIVNGCGPVNTMIAPYYRPGWDGHDVQELQQFIKGHFGEDPLTIIPVITGGMRGVLYVTDANPTRVTGYNGCISAYVKRMYVCEDSDLIPLWARSMVGGIIEFDLQPSASRESLIQNGEYFAAAGKLAALIVNHLAHLAQTDRSTLHLITLCHNHSLKNAVLQDKYLLEQLVPFLNFRTNHGLLSLSEIQEAQPKDEDGRTPILGFESAADKLRFDQLYTPKGRLVVNCESGSLDREVILEYCRQHQDSLAYREIGVDDGLVFAPLDDEEATYFSNLQKTVAAVLRMRGYQNISVETRRFHPQTMALTIISEKEDWMDPRVIPAGSGRFSGLQSFLMECMAQRVKNKVGKIFLNADNPTIRQLVQFDLADGWLDNLIYCLFCQALLLAAEGLDKEHRLDIYENHHRLFSKVIELTMENIRLKSKLRQLGEKVEEGDSEFHV